MDKVVISSESSGAIYTSVAKICTIESISASMHLTHANVSRHCEHDITASASITWNHWLLAHRLPKHWLLAGAPPARFLCLANGCMVAGGRCAPCSLCVWPRGSARPLLSLSVSSHGGSAHPLLFHNSAHRFSLAEGEHEIERTEINTSPFLVSVLYFVLFFKYKKLTCG